jgi:hypothetical protein
MHACSYEIVKSVWDEHNKEREKRTEPMKLNFSLGHRIEMKI